MPMLRSSLVSPSLSAGGGPFVVATGIGPACQRPEPVARPARRLQELDSLRGIAAVIVVFTHFHDMWLDDRFYTIRQASLSHLHNLLIPLYAGHQAVMLFFLLSGFVLALPFERGRPLTYPAFFVRRVTRIYGPYLAALALATAGAFCWHGDLHHGPWAAATWNQPPTLLLILQHVLFLGVYDFRALDPPIWSLIHEMRISILFPFLWLATRRLGAVKSLLLPAAFSLLAAFLINAQGESLGTSIGLTLHYAGFFVIGILLARRSLLNAPRPSFLSGSLAVASAAVFFYGSFGLAKFAGHLLGPTSLLLVSDWSTLAGAVGLVYWALQSPRLLNRRLPLFTGRISYSLYLVHFPVLMGLTFAAETLSPWIQFPLYLGMSFALATVFCLYVEEPVTRWGRRMAAERRAA